MNNDKQLLQRIVAGDAKACDIICRQHRTILTLQAIHKIKDRDEAISLVDEFFRNFFANGEYEKINIPLAEYLENGVKQACKDHLKSKHSIRKSNWLTHTCWEVIIKSSDEEKSKFMQLLINALDEVSPPACRKMIKYFGVENSPNLEIDNKFQIKVQLVRNRFFRRSTSFRIIFQKSK